MAKQPGLQVLGDGAYGSGETLNALGKARHQRAIKPWPIHAAVPGGFYRDDFVMDEAGRHRHLPGRSHRHDHAEAALPCSAVRCRGCPLRERCTRSKDGRTLHLTPHDGELIESRRAWRDG